MKKLIAATALSLTQLLTPAQAEEQAQAPKTVTTEQVAREIRTNTQYLSRHALGKAKALMEAYGDFAPFGAGLLPNGDVKYVWAVKPGEEIENINAPLVLDAIRRALATQADSGRILGSAVIYQYKGDEQPQINIELEYLTGFAQILATRYRESDAGIEYGEGVMGTFDAMIFVENRGNSAN